MSDVIIGLTVACLILVALRRYRVEPYTTVTMAVTDALDMTPGCYASIGKDWYRIIDVPDRWHIIIQTGLNSRWIWRWQP